METSKQWLAIIASIFMLTGFSTPGKAFNDKAVVEIPSGEFTRGCTRKYKEYECLPEALPEKKVFISKFKIDKYKVTYRRYNECMKKGNCTDLYFGGGCNAGMPWNSDHPVNCVTYKQAETFCKWDGGKRLPTEAEWEKAARGTDKRFYPWGNKTPSCNLATISDKTTRGKMEPGCGMGTSRPVNANPEGASPYGVMGMTSNLLEWTSDWFDAEYYKKNELRDPKGADRNTGFKTLRGATWMMKKEELDVSIRVPYAPEGQGYIVGFRCAG
ncbi:formylglycine-generating enzyme family protein [Endozoicomonas arenosclerae]|uniref:formylglycine-generating enzyme family protein n=1 Tax=Endozoicomonas arenosclerae TaxID=1633495 RepID=UPI0007838265|nr:formylglycine-generating enzyme family protein [Endozoicomonas arenosclerae]